MADIYRQGDYDRPGYELAATVEPGDSGGGVFDADGRLLAVVFASSRNHPDRAWATAARAARPLLADAVDPTHDPGELPCSR